MDKNDKMLAIASLKRSASQFACLFTDEQLTTMFTEEQLTTMAEQERVIRRAKSAVWEAEQDASRIVDSAIGEVTNHRDRIAVITR